MPSPWLSICPSVLLSVCLSVLLSVFLSFLLPFLIFAQENEVNFQPDQWPGLPDPHHPTYANYTERLLVGYRYYDQMKLEFTTGTPAWLAGWPALLSSFPRARLPVGAHTSSSGNRSRCMVRKPSENQSRHGQGRAHQTREATRHDERRTA